MELADIYQGVGSWLDNSGPLCDIVISSRVRLARNVAGHLFCGHATEPERVELYQFVRGILLSRPWKADLWYVDIQDTSQLQRQLLIERHVISKQLAEEDGACGVALTHDESLALMINEEDHLRIQVLASGLQLAQQYERINGVDSVLDEKIDYAFSADYGYLTACPTNVGTGLRVSVMLHLPALKIAGQIDKLLQAAKDMHLAVRGLYGEGSQPVGDLYQLSNQTTLGKTEMQIIDELVTNAVEPIVKYERQARHELLAQRRRFLEDKIYRSLGLLGNARMISSDETLYMLSYVRLGIHLGRITDVSLPTVNLLLQLTRPAHLQHLYHKELDPAERDAVRADFIRKKLN